jgi:hypothetical protein
VNDLDPRIRAALDRFAPTPGTTGADWADVRTRAGARAPQARPRRLRRIGGVAVAALAVLAGVALFALLVVQGPSGDRPVAGTVGAPAPDVTFPVVYPDPTYGLVEPETRLAALRGQVVVLSFIDTTCPECAAAADVLGTVSMAPTSALVVVSGEPAEAAARFATAPVRVTTPQGRRANAFRGLATAADPGGAIGRAFGVTRHPTIVLIDRRGRIARRYESVPSSRTLQREVGRLVAQPPPRGLPAPPLLAPHLGVFDDPATVWDGRPASLLPRSIPCPAVPGSFRLAASGPHGEALLLGEGIDGSLIRISHYGGRLGGGIGCGAPRFAADREKALTQARNRGHLGYESGGAKGHYEFSIVVLDGYDRITIDGTAYPIRHNGFIRVLPAKPTRVVISGPAGERRVRLF